MMMVREWFQEIRHSLRSLAGRPGFVVVAILSLSLGIGVNTAIFSALNSLLFRPLSVRDLDRTVYVYHADRENPDRGTSFVAYEQYRDRSETFSNVTAIGAARPLSLTDGDRREQVYAELVTSEFFSIASVSLHMGRPFDRDADRPSMPSFVAVVSDAFWKRRFRSDPTIIGKIVNLNGRAFTITGVSAPGFTGLDAEASADFWIPLTTWAHIVGEPGRLTGDEHWVTTIAQLKDGVTLDQAQAAMAVAGRDHPPGRQTRVRSVRVRSAGSEIEALTVGGGAFALGLLVLALACMNVSNLLLARAAARQNEMSLRLALGSGRGRLIRLWLTEALLLSVAAGIIGLPIGSSILRLVVAFKLPTLIGHAAAPTLPISSDLDFRVFAFALGLCALTAALVGVTVGLQGSRPMLETVRAGGASDRRFAPGLNLRSLVVALQMALSLILLIPCGLFVRSWLNATAVSPGFSSEGVVLLSISTDQAGVRVQKPPEFDRHLAERVAALPGVESAAVMDPVPLWFGGRFAYFTIDDGPASVRAHRIGFAAVSPGYFETMRIPVVRGRGFTASDHLSAPPVAIVNETMARRFWSDGQAVGRRLRRRDRIIEIVGVARDAKYLSLAEAEQPWLYQPIAQEASNNPALSLAARTAGDPLQLIPAIEREVRALVPAWPWFQFRTLDEGLRLQALLPRFAATLLAVSGAFGLLLAALGIYGVMEYVVKQRTREIGIRLALGSSHRALLMLVIREGMTVALAGAAVGIGAAFAVTRLLASVLYGIGAADPLTFVSVPVLLCGVALLACYLPARQATRVNPLDVLRHD